MATKEKNLEGALKVVKESLGAESVGFSTKAEASLDLLDAALGFFAAEGVLAKASVEMQMQTRTGKRYVCKYALGSRYVDGEEVPYLKKSETEEDA